MCEVIMRTSEEKRKKEIEEAKQLLRDNGYVIIPISKKMQEDLEECEYYNEMGEEKDCISCSCNICIGNY